MLNKEIIAEFNKNAYFSSACQPHIKGFIFKALASDHGAIGGFLFNRRQFYGKIDRFVVGNEISRLLDEISCRHVLFKSPPKEWGINMRHSFNNIVSMENGVIILIGDSEESFRGVDLSFVNDERILSRVRRK